MISYLRTFGPLLVCVLLGCSKNIPASSTKTQFPHTKGDWLKWRAQERNISLEQARQEDDGWDRAHKPDLAQRAYLHQEGRALWDVHCAVCHGTNGNDNPQNFNPAPRKLGGMGLKMGFFFGGDKMRAGIFHKIKTGNSLKTKPQPQQMPAFRDLLHNEQIWALVLHLESL